MPAFTFTSPEGRKYTVNGPEGATPEQAFSILQQHLGASPPPASRNNSVAETIDAAVRGAANAATFGFADRIAAGLGAATGIGGKFGDYAGNLEAQRAIDRANLEQHPAATIGGNIAGGLALPVGAAASAPTLGARTSYGLGAGGAQGALYGIGESPDLRDTATVGRNALASGAKGALLGGIAPPVVEGAGMLARAAADRSGIPQAVRGVFNPEAVAAKTVASHIQGDRAGTSPLLSEQAFQEAANRGQPVSTIDLGGDATRRLADTAAIMSPDAQRALEQTANARFEGQSNRIAHLLTGLGGGNSVETLDRLQEAARRANRPLYQKAYAEGSGGVWNPELARLSEAPAVQDAIRKAVKTGANADIAAGIKPTVNPFSVGADGQVSLKQGVTPTLQFWDHVKRNLDDMEQSAKRAGENHAASTFRQLNDSLLFQLDKAAPTYSTARGTAAKAFGARDALEAGAKFVNAKGKNQEYAKTIASMSAPEKQLFAHGFLSELENKIREVGNRRNVIVQIYNSPSSRQRIEMAVGKDKAKQLETFLHAETVMDLLRTRVSGGSQTARRLADLAAAPAIVGTGTYLGSGGDIKDATMAGAAAALVKHGVKGVNAGVMRRIGEMLASDDPAVHKQALKMINASPAIKRTLRPFAPGLAAGATAYDAEKRKTGQ